MRRALEAAPAPPGAASSRPRTLTVAIGQHSDAGRKSENQDSHGASVPEGPALALKGVALAIADGISTSPVGRIAAETAVKSFLDQYYSTSDTWTVETAGQRVIRSVNGWLHAETRRSSGEDPDRGHVCTFSAVILKARTAHLFHIGDARIFRLAGRALEPLTEDHRLTLGGRSYLGRALGMGPEIAIDYRTLPIAEGDVLVLSTDGVHEHLPGRVIADLIAEHGQDLEHAARRIVEAALEAGSDDNLTVQIVRIESLPEGDAADLVEGAEALPPAPILTPPCEFEGYRVLRQIHASHRSHIYLAADGETGQRIALKIPSVELRGDPDLLRQFMMEDWIARRVDSPHLLKVIAPARPRSFLYVVAEHVEGITLRQWMYDNPAPDLPAVRDIVDQLVRGVRALHRKQMVHGDLRPENVMITPAGLVKVIDFGSVRAAGLVEAGPTDGGEAVLGTVQYTAPECLMGEPASWRSDLFAIGVIAYEMLTGKLPYGAQAARVRTRDAARALRYTPAAHDSRAIPSWIDGALRCAVHPDPTRRHEALSEFVADLKTPNPRFARTGFQPLAERDPVRFWQGVSLVLALVVFALLVRVFG
ncbi:bifunctional protein-serine/threonine kinase/phosphatase [Phenylobacterium sp.]|jgi:serine/threonine protein phosphatase PrpC|uniref:bifunctional protein-serine/threonine kinase/phosphatase n=1 Tax=Phenylobacterium sp. TaxID=1871053 RepID=UPI002E300BB2|nr:bifunctional protein-serine/threonine kinase/phosphatase [Phenylobacterium sp.]HEX2559210.1 bifunctional protein-serine/threonine kinase/phosphatase [Phenylobacterium sp.]